VSPFSGGKGESGMDLQEKKEKYDALRSELLSQLDEIQNDPVINEALNISLTNTSEITDYDEWIEGANKFADDNHDVLMDWLG
jgi:hypothetical protein